MQRSSIHAPTGRLGDDPRRSLSARARWASALSLVAWAAVACLAPGPAERGPVTVAVVGPVLQPSAGTGPPIECRGLALDRCETAGSFEGDLGGVARADIERVIVSCEGTPCTADGGAMRLDLLLRNGTTVEVARGGYGAFRQP